MSLKHNVLAGYVSQVYVTIIGIIMVPLYVKYMGAETYGLVGFYATLQAAFSLLDMGLTPTISRETARFRGGALDSFQYRRLVRAVEAVFLGIAVLGGSAIYFASGCISTSWLHVQMLSAAEVKTAIEIMAPIIAMRWMSGLYRGSISGSERLVWLGGYNVVFATLRFIGVLPVLKFIGTTPSLFFGYQLGVASLELAGLLFHAYRLLPAGTHDKRSPWSFSPIKTVLKFSLGVAVASSTWVLVTQVDKLVLSRVLPLAEYGYFTLAVLVAGGVTVTSGPITAALMPRMAKQDAEGDQHGLIRLYRQATQFVAVIGSSSSAILAFFAKPVLWAWTGDKHIAEHAAYILSLYAMGNGILAVATFPYYLQYAKGNLRLQMIVNILFILLLIPTVVWAASRYGGIGAGYVWFLMNAIYLALWVPIVHRHIAPGLNRPWFGRDVFVIYAAAYASAFGLFTIVPEASDRWWQLGEITMISFSVLLAAALASSFIVTTTKTWVKAIRRQLSNERPA